MRIRPEKPTDKKVIYELIREAFATAEHSDGTEQELVDALRNSDAYIPELSLVAEIDDEIVGHIMFTKAKVKEEEVLALAPLSVKPSYQKQQVGTKLIEEGHRLASELGFTYSVVLGSDLYYPKFGYVPVSSLGISAPSGIPSEYFMAIKLSEEAPSLKGEMSYAKEFGLA